MNGRVQKVVISVMTTSCRPVVGSVLLTCVLSPALLHRYIILIIGQSLHKSSDNTKLRSVTDTPDNHAVIQRNLDRLEKWAGKNFKKFNKEKSKILYLGRKKPRHQYSPSGAPARKQLGREGPEGLGRHQVCI